MPNIWVARRNTRMGLYIPMQGTKKNPNLMFFLPKCDPGQLDQMVRKQLAEQGITKESLVHKVIEKAELEYERNVKIGEVKAEVKRLMAIRAAGGKLMQFGRHKWKQVFHPAVNQFQKQ